MDGWTPQRNRSFSEWPMRSSHHLDSVGADGQMVEGVMQRRHSPVTSQGALKDSLAILGPQDVGLQFEGLVARRSAGRSRFNKGSVPIAQKTCQTTR